MKIKHISFTEAITNFADSKFGKYEKNDCVVKAVATAFEVDYDAAHEFVRIKFKRINGQGTFNFYSHMNVLSTNDFEFSNKKIRMIKRDIGMKYKVKINGFPSYRATTTGNFIKTYPNGTYIVMVEGHAFTIKDGVIIGNFSDAKKLRKVVYAAWKIE